MIANTIQGIALGYFNVILQIQRMNELEKQLQLSRDKYEYVKVKSNYGGAVASDRLQEEVNYLTFTVRGSKAERRLLVEILGMQLVE